MTIYELSGFKFHLVGHILSTWKIMVGLRSLGFNPLIVKSLLTTPVETRAQVLDKTHSASVNKDVIY